MCSLFPRKPGSCQSSSRLLFWRSTFATNPFGELRTIVKLISSPTLASPICLELRYTSRPYLHPQSEIHELSLMNLRFFLFKGLPRFWPSGTSGTLKTTPFPNASSNFSGLGFMYPVPGNVGISSHRFQEGNKPMFNNGRKEANPWVRIRTPTFSEAYFSRGTLPPRRVKGYYWGT